MSIISTFNLNNHLEIIRPFRWLVILNSLILMGIPEIWVTPRIYGYHSLSLFLTFKSSVNYVSLKFTTYNENTNPPYKTMFNEGNMNTFYKNCSTWDVFNVDVEYIFCKYPTDICYVKHKSINIYNYFEGKNMNKKTEHKHLRQRR